MIQIPLFAVTSFFHRCRSYLGQTIILLSSAKTILIMAYLGKYESSCPPGSGVDRCHRR